VGGEVVGGHGLVTLRTDQDHFVADVDRVVLLTIVLPTFPDIEAGNNQIILNTAGQYDNVNYLAWDGLAAGCSTWAEANGQSTDCFAADGIHMSSSGARYYAALVTGLLDQI